MSQNTKKQIMGRALLISAIMLAGWILFMCGLASALGFGLAVGVLGTIGTLALGYMMYVIITHAESQARKAQ